MSPSVTVTVTLRDCAVFFGCHDIDKSDIVIVLNRGGGRERDVGQCTYEQLRIDKFIGEKSVIRVRESGFHLHGASRGIDLVIDGQQGSTRKFLLLVAIQCIHRQRAPVAQLGSDFGKIILGYREHHGYRLQLRDHEQTIRPVGRHDVPGVDQAQPHAPIDGREDAGVIDVYLGRIQVPLIQLDDALVLVDGGLLRGELLFGNGMNLVGFLVAIEVDERVPQQRLIARELSLGLNKSRLIRPRDR